MGKGGNLDDHPKWRAYIVVLGGILVHLTLGTIYTFGNMSPYMTSYFRIKGIAPDISYEDSIWINALAAMGQGSSVFIGGLLVPKLGPRKTTLLGAWISSAGVLLTYFTVQHSFPLTVLTYGGMFGIGVGIAYAVPMGCAMKWLPHRKGLVNGLVVAGFGGGAFIFDQIQTAFLNPDNKVPDKLSGSEKYFDQDDILDKVPECFLLLGGCYAGLQLIGSLLIKDPPTQHSDPERTPLISSTSEDQSETNGTKSTDSESPHGIRSKRDGETGTLYSLPNAAENVSDEENYPKAVVQIPRGADKEDRRIVNQELHETDEINYTPKQVLRDKYFYILWSIYLVNGQGIQFISTLYKAYGQTFIKDDHFLAIVGSLAAVCNGGGRIMWGYLADKFSVRSALMVSCCMFCILMLTFELTSLVGKGLFLVYVCLLFLAFCGNFALMPTATARTFGQKYYGVNYGLVFTSSVITAPISAVLTSNLKEKLGWHGMFFLVSGFTFISVILAWCFKVNKHQRLKRHEES